MDYTVHGILQARILEWVDFPFSRGSFQPRDQTQVSCTAGRFLYHLCHKGSPRIREWVAYPFSSGSSPPRNWTGVSCIASGFFTNLSGKVGIVPQRRSNHGKKGLMRFHLHYWLSALLEWTCLFFFSSSFTTLFLTLFCFPGGSDGKALACNSGDSGPIHGLRRFPGEGNGNPLSILAWKIPWSEEPGRFSP